MILYKALQQEKYMKGAIRRTQGHLEVPKRDAPVFVAKAEKKLQHRRSCSPHPPHFPTRMIGSRGDRLDVG